MPNNADIREIGGGAPAQRVVSTTGAPPARDGAQLVVGTGPQDERRWWSDLFDWGHHNTSITQTSDSNGS